MLHIQHLHKSYPAAGGPLVILDDVSLSLPAGDAVAIMGPSGSGKSTLLYIIGTLDRPTRGEIRIGAQDPFALGERELSAFRNETVGFVFQDHCLLPQCTVLENVLTPTLVSSRAGDAVARARALLDRVGLGARLDHRPAALSGGEKQRAAIARALVNRPRLILCDEPTGNLDHRSADAIGSLLRELQHEQGATLVVVTHSAEFARRWPHRFELIDGALEAR